MIAVGIVIGGGLLTEWSNHTPEIEIKGVVNVAQSACSAGDEVSNFICRNSWMGQHRHSYR